LKQHQKLLTNNGLVLLLSIFFIVANATLIANDCYYLSLLPAVLLIVYLSAVSLDKLLYLVVFFVPVSLPLEDYAPDLGFNLQIPTEPILAGMLVLFIFRLLYERKFNRNILLHPVSIAIYINLFWIFFTSVTSTMPIVSFKFLISRLWFVVAFYFIATQIFAYKNNMRKYVWAYIPLMLFVIGYAIWHLSLFGLFNQQAAHLSANPFFRDHTSYGCILAMLIPFIVGFAMNPKYLLPWRILCWLLVFVLCFALLLSYSRAAWVSIFLAIFLLVIIWLRIKIRTILLVTVAIGTLFFTYQTEITQALDRNRQDSSKDLMKHVQSITNIRTDVSNVERLNRWKSAFRMFHEHPVVGWGPGTYMFQYAPFQLFKDKTPISTDFGNLGNAHSEYIGPLAESGVLGCLSVLLIVTMTLYTSIKVYRKAKGHRQTRILILSATFGVITYYTHGALNDFLDTDKASALLWGYTAMIVALDVYHVKAFKGEKAEDQES
jgi:putative inorganic carbon (hco3(-)) transporter